MVRALDDAGGIEGAERRLRVPPQSLEAEQSLLGGLMIDGAAWDKIADIVVAEDFYRPDHRLIFEALAELAESSQPRDVVTVSQFLDQRGKLDPAGGLEYLATLANETPGAANVRAYALILRERATLRSLIEAGNRISGDAYSTDGRSAAELVDTAEQLVFEIAEKGSRGRVGFRSLKQILPETVDRIDLLHQSDGDITGIATGYNEFDKMTAGLQPGELIVIAGRPSMGKTTLAINMAENAAIGGRVPTAIFSMEMPSQQLAFRMISSLGRVDQAHLRTGNFPDEDWSRINTAVQLMSDAPIFIDDSPALSPTEVRARARRLKREHGLGLIVLDYLQLMQVHGTTENRATEISEISRSMKALAKELELPIIALSQLNRSVEQRTDKRPVMSDLRECVTGDTLVWLEDGRRVPISSLVGLEPEVWSIDEQQRLTTARSDKVWCAGRKAVFRVQLASGRSIRATVGHRLMAGRGWTTVGDLAPGDRLAIVETLPVEVFEAVRARMRDRGASTRAMAQMRGTACGGASHFRFAPGRTTVANYAQLLSSPDLAQWAKSDLFWDRVTSVVPEGEEEVFDLTVPGPANWIADGIVTHNSGAIEQDADLIVFIYRDEIYNKESPRKGIADITIAKQRNGPVGDFLLTFVGRYTKFENFISDSYAEEGYP